MTLLARRQGLLVFLLALALAGRATLALAGGQYFFNDELRYQRGIELWQALTAGRTAEVRELLARPEHAAFTLLGALLTPVQHGLARLGSHGDWTDPANLYASAGWAALLLSLSGVLNILLTRQLAVAAGASDAEADWVALLMAASNTLLCYARNLLPYDVALSAWLASLWLGTSSVPRRQWAAGLLAGLTYHLYNGYWFLVPLALAWSCLHPGPARKGRPAWRWLAGGAVGLAGPFLPGALAGGAEYWRVLLAFSATANQGLYAEGWSLPWEYLWHAEGWPGVVVLAAVLAALARLGRNRPGRVLGWCGLLAGAYGLLVLCSSGLGRFVVYGRTVHPFIPPLCLLGGWAAGAWGLDAKPWRPLAIGGLIALVVIQAATHLALAFPHELELQVMRNLGIPKRALSFSGSLYRPLQLPVTRPDLALVNAQFLYPLRQYTGYPSGRSLYSAPHPLAYPPFQYEGFTPRERLLLRNHPPEIRLVALDRPAEVPDHPPADTLFTGRDRPDGRDADRP